MDPLRGPSLGQIAPHLLIWAVRAFDCSDSNKFRSVEEVTPLISAFCPYRNLDLTRQWPPEHRLGVTFLGVPK